MQNNVPRFIRLALQPSLFSGIITVLLSSIILGVATLSYANGSGIVYEFLFGENSSTELIQTSRGTFAAISNTVFGNPTLNKLLYFVFWMLVGLLTYILLYSLIRGASTTMEDVEETNYVNVTRGETLRIFITHSVLHIAIVLCWFVYTLFFIKIFLPFSILSGRIGLTMLPGIQGWLYGLLGLIVLIGSLHIHVVLLRFSLLKVRAFGGEDLV